MWIFCLDVDEFIAKMKCYSVCGLFFQLGHNHNAIVFLVESEVQIYIIP